MAAELKRFIIGRALRTEQAAHERLSKKTALAVFSSDALSSTAYATEEILLVLAVAAVLRAGGCFQVRRADFDRHRRASRYRCNQLPANDSRLPVRRRRLHSCQREPRH